MFSNVDGEFPNHHPDPSNLENLKDLQNKVLELKKSEFVVKSRA